MVDCGQEAGQSSDAVLSDVADTDETQMELRDGQSGVYAQGGADALIEPLAGGVREVRVESKRVSSIQVDELAYCRLDTRDTEDRAAEQSG